MSEQQQKQQEISNYWEVLGDSTEPVDPDLSIPKEEDIKDNKDNNNDNNNNATSNVEKSNSSEPTTERDANNTTTTTTTTTTTKTSQDERNQQSQQHSGGGGGPIGAQLRKQRNRQKNKRKRERKQCLDDANHRIQECVDAMGIQPLVEEEEKRQLKADEPPMQKKDTKKRQLKADEPPMQKKDTQKKPLKADEPPIQKKDTQKKPLKADEPPMQKKDTKKKPFIKGPSDKGAKLEKAELRKAEIPIFERADRYLVRDDTDITDMLESVAQLEEETRKLADLLNMEAQLQEVDTKPGIPGRRGKERVINIRSEQPSAPESIPIQRMPFGGAEESDFKSPFEFLIEVISLGDEEAAEIPVTPVGQRNKDEKFALRNQMIPTEQYGTFSRPLEHPSFFPGFEDPIILNLPQIIELQPQQTSKKEYYRGKKQKGGKQMPEIGTDFKKKPASRPAAPRPTDRRRKSKYSEPKRVVNWIEPGRERELEERLARIVIPQEGQPTMFGDLRASLGPYMHYDYWTGKNKKKRSKPKNKRRDKRVSIPIKFEGDTTGLFEGVKETLKNKTEDAKKFLEDTVSKVNISMAPEQEIMKDLREEMSEENLGDLGGSLTHKGSKEYQKTSADTGDVHSVPVAFVLLPTGGRNFGAEA